MAQLLTVAVPDKGRGATVYAGGGRRDGFRPDVIVRAGIIDLQNTVFGKIEDVGRHGLWFLDTQHCTIYTMFQMRSKFGLRKYPWTSICERHKMFRRPAYNNV